MSDMLNIVEEASPVYNIKHRAFYLAKDVILFLAQQRYEKMYVPLIDQLIRSVSSVGANLVEGVAGSSKNDFLKFNVIALKSANETKYWLSLIKETMNFEKERVKEFITEADEISKIIATIIINTKK